MILTPKDTYSLSCSMVLALLAPRLDKRCPSLLLTAFTDHWAPPRYLPTDYITWSHFYSHTILLIPSPPLFMKDCSTCFTVFLLNNFCSLLDYFNIHLTDQFNIIPCCHSHQPLTAWVLPIRAHTPNFTFRHPLNNDNLLPSINNYLAPPGCLFHWLYHLLTRSHYL